LARIACQSTPFMVGEKKKSRICRQHSS